MMLDYPLIFQLAMSIVSVLGGWLLKSLFERIKDLEIADKLWAQAVATLREELPTYYVRRDSLKELSDSLFSTLRRIEDKLDKKVDKP
jgi:hypothetical protein